MKKSILYHIIFIICLCSGSLLLWVFGIGFYEFAQAHGRWWLWVVVSIIAFFFSVRFVARYRVESVKEAKERQLRIEKAKKRIAKIQL